MEEIDIIICPEGNIIKLKKHQKSSCEAKTIKEKVLI